MSSESLHSGDASKTYSSFASDIPLVSALGAAKLPSLPRRIRVGSSGNLALEYAGGITDVITGLTAGEVLDLRPTKILASGSGTTITSCTVIW